ncbi:MAG TPA: spore cortex-lytic enzyme [Acetivibrio saccincola]|uniref:spore cortex-lytic enzyme n=1 Tax=Acetivibrio saccincola TaxID=1677857 RepID=UPI002C93B35E|nr:spore cortex-lytic enzyme [Acetivibrio saccincola]HOA97160.1 spore cortex-lytic enzyme [Acetivibrio saccincola]HQD28875.1 spore cortex-lytic enzyme [Acetivibrio saccincola]
MRKRNLLASIILIITSILAGTLYTYKDGIFDLYRYSRSAVSYYGSRSQEVVEIQTRLKKWGYYDGKIDGVYGIKTYRAVRKFQAKNGLKVDGVAGSQTLAALGIPTGSTGQSSDNNNLNLLAHIIHGEARGEPYVGQVAVGAVILNRVRDSRFPNTIAGVIYQPGAFEAVADGQINLPPNETSHKAARDALNGWDPTGGAIYYYNPATAKSKWIWTREIITTIGKHNFAK